ncbi:restriction endonuclease subunit S [bacterium]|nr:restriction endonuclease subunit S [bacterium]
MSKTTIGNLVTLKRGYDLPHRERTHGNIPIISSSGLTGWHNRSMVKGPGVVTGRYGTLGQVFYVEKDFWPLNTSLYVQDFKGNHPKFVYYFLKAVLSESFNSAGAVPGVNRNYLHKIAVPAVPKEKECIAAVLSAYDDLIENNNRRIGILEKMAEEIYKEWFVRMRFPGHQTTKFNKGIPEGWGVKSLGEILELAYGKALKTENRVDGQYPVYGSSGVVGTHSDFLVKGPGLIVGRKGNVGSVHKTDCNFYPIDTVYYVKSEYPFGFLFYLLKGLNFINSDAAVPGLNRKQAYSNKVFFPILDLIQNFDEKLNSVGKQINRLQLSIVNLKQTRDRLLTRLISGKLSVENLDISFPPSMKE